MSSELQSLSSRAQPPSTRIILISAPDYIKNLPSEQELENLFTKVSQKEIKPYKFELNQVE